MGVSALVGRDRRGHGRSLPAGIVGGRRYSLAVAEYLSDEWMDAAGAALSASAEPGRRGGGPRPDHRLRGRRCARRASASTRCRSTTARVALEPDAGSNAPVTFALDYESAGRDRQGRAVRPGRVHAGPLKLGGDVMILIRDAAALDGIDDALAELRVRHRRTDRPGRIRPRGPTAGVGPAVAWPHAGAARDPGARRATDRAVRRRRAREVHRAVVHRAQDRATRTRRGGRAPARRGRPAGQVPADRRSAT